MHCRQEISRNPERQRSLAHGLGDVAQHLTNVLLLKGRAGFGQSPAKARTRHLATPLLGAHAP